MRRFSWNKAPRSGRCLDRGQYSTRDASGLLYVWEPDVVEYVEDAKAKLETLGGAQTKLGVKEPVQDRREPCHRTRAQREGRRGCDGRGTRGRRDSGSGSGRGQSGSRSGRGESDSRRGRSESGRGRGEPKAVEVEAKPIPVPSPAGPRTTAAAPEDLAPPPPPSSWSPRLTHSHQLPSQPAPSKPESKMAVT